MSRRFVFTLNNPEMKPDELLLKLKDHVRYAVFQLEKGAEGTLHYQGFINTVKAVRLTGAKKLISDRCHIEQAKGTDDDCKNYCTKSDTRADGPWEVGTFEKTMGKRTDIEHTKELLKNGASMRMITEEVASFQAIKYAEKWLNYNEKVPKMRDVEVRWYWGKTGVGKTYRALQECSDDYWISGKNLKWWQGYDAHKDVIIDDFRADFCTFHELLRILDKYDYTVENKGGSRKLKANRIWITSCFPPNQVYNTREDIDQLLRRLTVVEEMVGKNEPEMV